MSGFSIWRKNTAKPRLRKREMAESRIKSLFRRHVGYECSTSMRYYYRAWTDIISAGGVCSERRQNLKVFRERPIPILCLCF